MRGRETAASRAKAAALTTLKRLGLIGKGTERDRRPITGELNRFFRCFDYDERQTLPVTRIVRFAVATAIRLDEICRIEWTDLDVNGQMLMIRDRKAPRNKTGNDQQVPFFVATRFDACALVTEQAKELGHTKGRVFSYNSRSVGTTFRRACAEVRVKDLHFHDVRHEGTSRLFAAGLAIEQVSRVTGHKDRKMLRRYTHIGPKAVHQQATSRGPSLMGDLAAE